MRLLFFALLCLVRGYTFEYQCDNDSSLICARRTRCHDFLTAAATTCEGIEEYRGVCSSVTTNREVHLLITSIDMRFDYCL